MAKLLDRLIESKETEPIRDSIGRIITELEKTADVIYQGREMNIYLAKPLDIEKGLEIRSLPEYEQTISAISALRQAAAKKYHQKFIKPN